MESTDTRLDAVNLKRLINEMTSTEKDTRYTILQSFHEQPFVYVVWLFMIAFVMTIYYYVIGFDSRFTIILGVSLLFVMVANMFLSGVDSYNSYELELADYAYVEQNARSFLPFGIALAALVIAANRKEDVLTSEKFMGPLLLATCCFVFVLTNIWMPRDSGRGIRFYRDIKSAILALGGATIIALVGEFVFSNISNRPVK